MKTANHCPLPSPPAPKSTMPNASEDVEQLDPSYTAGDVKLIKGNLTMNPEDRRGALSSTTPHHF